jgi:DNA polymerase I-like protein with 3'-5' exonuclease and polymerase domains
MLVRQGFYKVPLFKTLRDFYTEYEMPLAQVFHEIDRRGVLVSQERLANFLTYVDGELKDGCQKIENEVKLKVIAKGKKGTKPEKGVLNLSSPSQIKDALASLGIKLKKDRMTGKESTGEEALNEAYVQTGNSCLKEILRVRELNKIRGTYAEATLVDSILYTSYGVAGTVTGRRASRETPFTSSTGHKIGTNAQNLPKQSELGKRFRECIVSRPGRIFVSCDQAQAEDWIVQGIIADNGGGTRGLEELRKGTDRHQRLASEIFNKPLSECGKDTMYRFFGKKTRHAGNYDMRAPMMAVSLAKEGFHLGVKYCEFVLDRFHNAEPEIRNTFHFWVQSRLKNTRTLSTPIGRTRYFFGLRPGSDNSKIFKEAYSYVPQSTVGDNTGLSVLFCERTSPGGVIMDTHDAVTLEVEDSIEDIRNAINLLQASFDREIIFDNGLVLKIPVEFELGYDLKNEKKVPKECLDNLEIGLPAILATLVPQVNPQ